MQMILIILSVLLLWSDECRLYASYLGPYAFGLVLMMCMITLGYEPIRLLFEAVKKFLAGEDPDMFKSLICVQIS